MAVKHQGRQPQPPVSGIKNILIEQLDQRLGLDNRLAAGAHSSRGGSCPRRPGGRRLSRTTPLPHYPTWASVNADRKATAPLAVLLAGLPPAAVPPFRPIHLTWVLGHSTAGCIET